MAEWICKNKINIWLTCFCQIYPSYRTIKRKLTLRKKVVMSAYDYLQLLKGFVFKFLKYLTIDAF